MGRSIGAYRRILARKLSSRRDRIFTRKKKKQKERTIRKGRPVETAAAVEIDQGGLRQHLLDDFHHCLKKAFAKTASAFFTVTHRPDSD
jgi:hypothetical protein